jgi:PPK2 family polyphosphate:nucleotide phosphotransferase
MSTPVDPEPDVKEAASEPKSKKRGRKERLKDIEKLLEPYRVTDGKGFRLSDINPRDTRVVKKDDAARYLAEGVRLLAEHQDKLYAQDQWGVLLLFQAMDAAGKDGAIRHVMSGVNPQGCQVYSFKAPSSEEMDHDFLWRTSKSLPERGRIGIFNRSYYEEVLVVRVHDQILRSQKLPRELISKRIWEQRYEDIAAFERYLARQGYLILKFFLHVSKKAQKERFLERLDRPDKNWKFSLADARERGYWGRYMKAYEDLIRATAAPHAPWFVVPADRKWFSRLVVAAAIYHGIEELDLKYPKVDEAKKRELQQARAALEGAGEKKKGKRKKKDEEPEGGGADGA